MSEEIITNEVKEPLRDSRWQNKVIEVFTRDGFKCVQCGSEKDLKIHNIKCNLLESAKRYRAPWEYENKFLTTLCGECHEKAKGSTAQRTITTPIIIKSMKFTDFFGDKVAISESPTSTPSPISSLETTADEVPQPLENNEVVDVPNLPMILEESLENKNEVVIKASYLIDVVYSYLHYNYEHHGYNDALTNSDTSSGELNKKQIRDKIILSIKQIRRIYMNQVSVKEKNLYIAEKAGLLDIIYNLRSDRDVLHDHIKELDSMTEEISSNNGCISYAMASYDKGFKSGIIFKMSR